VEVQSYSQKKSIQHFQQEEIREHEIQATLTAVKRNGAEIIIGTIYCPPKHKIIQHRYKELFAK